MIGTSSAIRLLNTLPVDICQLPPHSFKTHLNSFRFIWPPDYALFCRLHCTVFIRSYCVLFAARLSLYTSAYSLIVRYCSESSQHRYRKMRWRYYKYELSRISPRGASPTGLTRIMLYIEMDDQCDKLLRAVGRTPTVASLVNLALSVHRLSWQHLRRSTYHGVTLQIQSCRGK